MKIYTHANKLKIGRALFREEEFRVPQDVLLRWLFDYAAERHNLSVKIYDEGELLDYLNEFYRYFVSLNAAGGLVLTPKRNRILMIRRGGVWDLPKGKIEEGENTEEAALREVAEETGCKELKLIRPFRITNHVFLRNQNRYLKTTQWYVMEAPWEQSFLPQTEENIEKVSWVPIYTALRLFPIHPLIKDLIFRLSL